MERRVAGGVGWAIAAAAVALTQPSAAQADSVYGTRSELLVESAHVVDVSLGPQHAELVVRRTVHNGGERHDQAVFAIDVPAQGVAAGLRTLGTHRGRPKWFAGELLEAEAAAARYRELTGIGGYYPKDPALLSWRSQYELALQVFPVAPHQKKTIEYTLWLPTEYEDGRYHVHLPAMGTGELAAELVVRPMQILDQVIVDGEPVGRGARFSALDAHTLSLARNEPPRLDGSLASVEIGPERELVHWELQAAARLSEVPRDADIVVLVDGSRSVQEDTQHAMREAARAYLRHFVGRGSPRAEVVVFDRAAHSRHGGLVSVRDAIADLQHLPIGGANGSHVDVALDAAAELLASRPRRPKRILLLTDGRTRTSLPDARLGTHVRDAGGLTHVGITRLGDPDLHRETTHPWSEAVRTTGGLVWALDVRADADAEALSVATEELARPVRIHELQLVAMPLSDPGVVIPDELDEGDGLHATLIADSGVRHVHLEGELWSTPVRHTLLSTAEADKLWSGLIFGDPLLWELTEDEMMPLALRAGVVSPVTSYLAIEPGVRPSTEGLEESEGIGLGGIGAGGGGFGSGSGSSFGSRHSLNREAFLQRALRDAVDACGGKGRDATFELETTSEEIVDVAAISIGGPADAVLERCAAERMWALALPGAFAESRKLWRVTT